MVGDDGNDGTPLFTGTVQQGGAEVVFEEAQVVGPLVWACVGCKSSDG